MIEEEIRTFDVLMCTGKPLEGANGPRGGAILAFSDTFFGAKGAEKLELLEIFWEKFGLSDTFLVPQAPKI